MLDDSIDKVETFVSESHFGAAKLGKIDQYELVRELGGGGFGTVYLARDNVAGIYVAVKGLPPEVKNNREELENIRKNFALVSRLTYPNIVKALVLHPAKDVRYASEDVRQKLRVLAGETLLVMDYAPGVTLSKWRKQFPGGKVPLEKALPILRQVAAALDYAHERKVIHRDVKPANIMLETQKNGKTTARVLDFGLAAEIRSSMGRVSQSLKSTAGTRPYMAPEQWEGEEQGPATDQYALAAMANELLTGKVPFSSVFDTGDPAVMMNVVLSRLFNPSSELPRHVRKALVKALAKKPQDRFASCTEFIDALAGKAASSSGGAFAKVAAVLAICGVAFFAGRVAFQRDHMGATSAPLPQSPSNVTNDVPEGRGTLDVSSGRGTLVVPSGRGTLVVPISEGATSAPLPDDDDLQARAAEFVRLRTRINIRKSDAADKMKAIDAFRADASGLESRLKIADEQTRTIAALATPNTVEEAREALKIVEDAEEKIALALDWLRENKTGRDNSKQERARISSVLADAKTFKASQYAKKKYNAAEALRKDGEKAFAAGDFASAGRKFADARRSFEGAVAEAKAFMIRTTLDSAREYFNASKWHNCIAEAEKVLAWDDANADAAKLKADALAKREPVAEFAVKIAGRSIPDGSTIKIGSNTYRTPIRWRVEDGQNYGGNDVAYESGGKRYFGKLERFNVDWRGPKLITIALAEYRGPKHGDTKTVTLPGGATMEFIYVAPGSFTMGSPASEDGRDGDDVQHRVTLTKGYWLGKYEVTQRQWQSVMGTNPSRFQDLNRPVENVSWDDCQDFIRKINAANNIGARLPTEAEWEYACRAGTTTSLPNGKNLRILGDNNGPELDDIAWYGGNSSVGFELSNGWDCSGWPNKQYSGSRAGTHPVGRKQPNAWGFYDMIGNVYEWCSDWYGDYQGDAVDPQGASSGARRVSRGGSWYTFARYCRSACRFRDDPGYRGDYSGFRLACSAGLHD